MLTKQYLKKFVTKDDLKKFPTKNDLQKMTKQIITEITEVIGILGEKIEKLLEEIHNQRIVLGDHEERIQKVETKIFPQI